MEYNDGTRYNGEWVLNAAHGFGIENWKDGTTYEGEY